MKARPGGERRAFWLFAVLTLILTIGLIVWLRPDTPERAVDDSRAEASESPTTVEPTPGKRVRPRRDASASPTGPALPLGGFPGLGTQPGMGGEGWDASLPPHQLTVRMSSSAPLGLIAWVIPTSATHAEGSTVVEGRTWSLSTTVYGDPDYAAVFVQAGPAGHPATCVITVDGRVTERRSTQGPHGVIWCQG